VANLVKSVQDTGAPSRTARRSRLTVIDGQALATRGQADAPADGDWGFVRLTLPG
jgi:hypothetical protein